MFTVYRNISHIVYCDVCNELKENILKKVR